MPLYLWMMHDARCSGPGLNQRRQDLSTSPRGLVAERAFGRPDTEYAGQSSQSALVNDNMMMPTHTAHCKEMAVAQAEQLRRNRALSTPTSTRGYLNVLATRSHISEEKKIDEDDMISYLHQALAALNDKYARVTYLGKHTAPSRENDTCLYARHRINGVSQCIGEIASLQTNTHTTLLHVNMHASDAALVQERGWGVPSPVGTFDRMATLCRSTKPSGMVLPMPRNPEELEQVIIPVLEAAVCCVAGVEQLA